MSSEGEEEEEEKRRRKETEEEEEETEEKAMRREKAIRKMQELCTAQFYEGLTLHHFVYSSIG